MNDPPQQHGKDGYPSQGYPSQGYPPQGYPSQGYPPSVGFVNPGYPSGQPQPTGFVPLVPPANNPYGNTPIVPPQHPGAYIDPEDLTEMKGFDFSEKTIRRGFIRKVYSILSVNKIELKFAFWPYTTLAFILLVKYEKNTLAVVQNNFVLLFVAIIVTFAALIAMACVESVRRTSPTNIIVLGIFTLAETYVVGASTIRFDLEDVLLAIGITAAVCVGLTIFAFQTKWDFTMLGGVLFVGLIMLILFSIIAMFFPGKTMSLVYSSCGAMLFCVYLIYDTQMMMGGEHKYSISPEEYIFGALALYLDIINIFIHILSIIGSSKN